MEKVCASHNLMCCSNNITYFINFFFYNKKTISCVLSVLRFPGFYRRSRCPQACYNLKSCSQRYLEQTLMFKCDPHFSCCAKLLNAQVRYSFCYIESNYNIAVHITLYIYRQNLVDISIVSYKSINGD